MVANAMLDRSIERHCCHLSLLMSCHCSSAAVALAPELVVFVAAAGPRGIAVAAAVKTAAG